MAMFCYYQWTQIYDAISSHIYFYATVIISILKIFLESKNGGNKFAIVNGLCTIAISTKSIFQYAHVYTFLALHF